MSCVLSLDEVGDGDHALAGGKAVAIARLARAKMLIPKSLVVTTAAYRQFLRSARLEGMLHMELSRKPFAEMRWEELWDTALRIRNEFLRASLPTDLKHDLQRRLTEQFAPDTELAVRSSAADEDGTRASFAGLHESVIGVRDLATLEDALRTVWASLWSDRALLYRQELGLDVDSSAMAVLIQEVVHGESSGVAFAVDPTDPDTGVVEAVYGQNQGLVDGAVEPDRWILDRSSGRILAHHPPAERRCAQIADGTVEIVAVPETKAGRPPLDTTGIAHVWRRVNEVSALLGTPQDVEWTVTGPSEVLLLQARPITTGTSDTDKRSWYLTLHRSLPNLLALRQSVENELLPAMQAEADGLASIELASLDDHALADEMERRRQVHDFWVDTYWREFIPLAHGIRLFGQLYNDLIRPDDPYEFADLLTATPLLGLERNRLLAAISTRVAEVASSVDDPTADETKTTDPELEELVTRFLNQFGTVTLGSTQRLIERRRVLRMATTMAGHDRAAAPRTSELTHTTEAFLRRVPADQRDHAHQLLDLARACYRLRDDDNIVLGRIAGQVLRASEAGRRRLADRDDARDLSESEVTQLLRNPNLVVEPAPHTEPTRVEPGFQIRPRQLTGQPAGAGVARGPARVILDTDDLFELKPGEILICDAVDPNMTFVVPLAAAVVERRGGMLIHGAIIAREYGLPCVTGVPGVTTQVSTGDQLTVDGFLGIITVE